jgi:hypothetical protein
MSYRDNCFCTDEGGVCRNPLSQRRLDGMRSPDFATPAHPGMEFTHLLGSGPPCRGKRALILPRIVLSTAYLLHARMQARRRTPIEAVLSRSARASAASQRRLDCRRPFHSERARKSAPPTLNIWNRAVRVANRRRRLSVRAGRRHEHRFHTI